MGSNKELRISTLKVHIALEEDRLRSLTAKQLMAPDTDQLQYLDEIKGLSGKIEQMKAELRQLQGDSNKPDLRN
jgi:hypothetical protein